MNIRMALLERAAAAGLPAGPLRTLLGAAALDEPPAGLAARTARGLAVAAGALAGFALVLWIAANWATFGRTGRFALLQAAVLVPGVAAWAWPQARSALALLAFLATGALWAFFGQTYQTGADAWQLFALWAGLGLPLALGVRSDVVWMPWVVVAVTAVVLWMEASGLSGWRGLRAGGLPLTLAAWCALIGLVLALGPLGRRVTGAGAWAMRTAVVLTAVVISLRGLMALFESDGDPLYFCALALFAAAAVVLSRRAFFDLFALSAVALALDALLVAGFARVLLDGSGARDSAGIWLLLGLLAAGVLAASVQAVMHVARKVAARDEGGVA
jgi:uncharacterized membrane protein